MAGLQVDEWTSLQPAVTIGELLQSLSGVQVLVEGTGTDQPIRWVHVSELADPTPYLRGHELMLTAGVHLPRTKVDADTYVARLIEAGVVGLGFGVDPVYHRVPDRLTNACRAHGLLLLRVPPDVPFIAVGEAHVRLLEESRRRAGELAARAQSQIVRAAARPRPVQAIVNTLGAQLGATVSLVDHRAGTRWTVGSMPPEAGRLERNLAEGGGVPRSAALHEPGLHAFAQLVDAPGRLLTLTISSPEPPAYPAHSLVGIASTVISLITGHTPTVRLAGLGEAVARYAIGSGDRAIEPAVSRALNVNRDGGNRWTVVAAAAPQGAAARSAAAWGDAFAEAVQSPLRCADGDTHLAVIADPGRARSAADHLATRLCAVGSSDLVSWRGLPGAARQAQQRLRVARAQRQVRGGSGSGLLPQLSSLVGREAAEQFAAAHLAPLLQRPPAESDRLVGTLRAWLEQDGNWDRTAASLGIHRNTVRNRVAAIQRRLDRDLRAPEARANLWLATQWHAQSAGEVSPPVEDRPGRR